MCLSFQNFSSLFELSAGFILVTHVVHSLYVEKLGRIEELEAKLMKSREEFPRDDEDDDFDLFLLKHWARKRKAIDEFKNTVSACKVGLLLGLVIPITAGLVGGYNAGQEIPVCEPEFTIILLLLLSFAWGPAWIAIFNQLKDRHFNLVEDELKEQCRRILHS